jgi:hypothetical protein
MAAAALGPMCSRAGRTASRHGLGKLRDREPKHDDEACAHGCAFENLDAGMMPMSPESFVLSCTDMPSVKFAEINGTQGSHGRLEGDIISPSVGLPQSCASGRKGWWCGGLIREIKAAMASQNRRVRR